MRVEHWKPVVTDERGVIDGGGAVGVEPKVDVTWSGEGCDCGTCRGVDCYIRANFGRDEEGVVRGMTIYFENNKELAEYLKSKGFFNTHGIIEASLTEN